MLEETLLTLAGAAGTAIVKSMATEAWTAVRPRVVGLFGRAGKKQQQAIEALLDQHRDALKNAPEDWHKTVLEELAPVWRDKVIELLEDRPNKELTALAADLRALVETATTGRPAVGPVNQSITGSHAGRDINQTVVGGDFNNIVRLEDGTVEESRQFVLPMTDWFNGPAAWGQETVDPSMAYAMVWEKNGARIVAHMQPWFDQGWVPSETPGPQHLVLEHRWRVNALGIAQAGIRILGRATGSYRSPFGPPNTRRWEAYAVRYQIMMTRRRPPDY